VFNVGGLELVAIGVLALVVLGPDKLPGALRQAGSMLRQLRGLSDSFRIDVAAALAEDVADPPGPGPRAD
jgi:sec-independent protein translocase protein TatB